MQMLEVQSLVKGKAKWVALLPGLTRYYKFWKELRKQYGNNNEMEAFIAGYTIGNNAVLKEEVLKYLNTQEKINNREKYQKEHLIDNFN